MSDRKLFGTDGIRGSASEPPLDDATVRAIGRALARTLAERLGRAPRLVSGRDTRESGPRIETSLAAGVEDEGGTIDSAGVITTPGVACVTRLGEYDAGIVVSASHNPYTDNGIKVFSPSGQKLDDEAEAAVEAMIPELRRTTQTGRLKLLHESPSLAQHYVEHLRTQAGDLDLSGVTLALDCANGAAYALAPQLFASLGADVRVLGADPDGRNINEGCGSLHLEGLGGLVRRAGADIGVPVDGDAVMYALAVDRDERGTLEGRRLVATVMSNVGLEVALAERGITLARTPVGDKNVLDELLRGGGSIGGEQSGHVIFPEISLAGDGMVTALVVLAALVRSGKPLAELVAGMRRFPQILLNVPVREKRPFEAIPEVAEAAAEVERELEGSGRLLLRYSGTENLARVMIEGKDETAIAAQAERIAAALRASIG